MKILTIVLLVMAAMAVMAVFFFINTCTGKKKMASYTATCGANTLKLEVYRQQRYAHSYHFLLISYPDIRPIRINQQDILDNGMPYKQGMYDHVPYIELDTVVHPITINTGTGSDSTTRYPYIVYVNPDKYTKEQFELLGNCMLEKWKELDDSLYKNFISPQQHLNYPQLMGLVYAKHSDFVQQYETKDKLIRITPDGRVTLMLKKEVANGNVELGGRVMEEGASIAFTYYGSETVPKDFSLFKHTKTGDPITKDFEISVQQLPW